MKDISREQWETLPDAPDMVKTSRKKRNQEYQRYTPVPDTILQSTSLDAQGGKLATSIDPNQEG